MNYILFDGPYRNALLPFTYTRPMAELEWGIGTIRESWERALGKTTTTITEEYLSEKFPVVFFEQNIFIHAAYFPTPALVLAIQNLKEGQVIYDTETLVAFRTSETMETIDFKLFTSITVNLPLLSVRNTWDLFAKNKTAIGLDFKALTQYKESEPISPTVQVIGSSKVFIAHGAQLEYCTLNATDGPIYIGPAAEVMEGSLIRGPFALGAGGVVKMGAKIYGATSVGAYSKVGGEVNNAILFSYSNKGHEGFLGNSIIGSWCNIGADTNTSNLKNSYEMVRLWNYAQERFSKTGLQFCGLMMGDHSKCAINTMFNTGTVVGVAANIFGSGFARNFVPSFSWGGIQNSTTYTLEKAIKTAQVMMERKDQVLSPEDKAIMKTVFEQSKKWRKNE